MSKAKTVPLFHWSKLSSPKWLDAWQERLGSLANADLVISTVPGKALARVELYSPNQALLKRIQAEWGGSLRRLAQRNWAALSDQCLPDLVIRGDLAVIDARRAQQIREAKSRHPGRQVLVIPADMAFGTGHHATTATVLRMLCDIARKLAGKSWKMADVGCGSGILAIGAVKLGAATAWACDFDPRAVEVSAENFVRNQVAAQTSVQCVDVLKWRPKRQWEVVAANIFVDVLEASAATLVGAVKPGGYLMVSGILKTHAAPCLKAFESLGVGWLRVVERGKWVSALGQLSGPPAGKPARRSGLAA
jgi:ribosomal protein L11 methyltransferase